MDATLAAKIQEVDQVSADMETMIDARIDAAIKEIHTMVPGRIVSYDAAKQRANVQPCIKRVWVSTGPKDLPQCLDCPVAFPAGGDMVMTFPVAAGDECMLHFAERCIDEWWDQGGTQEPTEYRLHDYSDGFAVVGVSSKPRLLTGVSTDATEIRTRDGSTKVSVKGGQVTVIATNVNVQATNVVVQASSVDLGAGSLVPLTDGVVLASGVDTLTGATYGVLGSASSVVKAKKA